MKLRNLIAALMLVVIATVGAFATAKATRLVTVFYKVSPTAPCLQGTVDVACPFINLPDCSKLVTPPSGPAVSAIIYSARVLNPETQLLECIDPYSITEP
ncbi:hypothetical protein [Pedobacter frigoris]|uniref:hypothetical protein n=1 Tax=Pedobacter frigoris TaxID=2571272 RepID=UPI00292F07C5|nr:hypothetical protein [Pedobacter frigoris]